MPVVGGRVLVPFRQQRVSGIVTALHTNPPRVKTRDVLDVIDATPSLDEQLLLLGKWIADYYLAPIGEVFRTMLPLHAEFKRTIAYRITQEGSKALHLAGMTGSPARSRRTPEEEAAEFRVLDSLAARASMNAEGAITEQTLRAATRVTRAVLNGMVRKKWIAREDVSDTRDATSTIRIAVLKSAEGRLNENQKKLIESLAASEGRIPVRVLQKLDVPRSTLGTLARRGVIEIVEEPADFARSRSKPRASPFAFDFNPAQKSALARLRAAVDASKFSGILMHGVTGSGKTAVYGGNARGAGGGPGGHPPGPRNRPHAGRGRRPAPDFRR